MEHTSTLPGSSVADDPSEASNAGNNALKWLVVVGLVYVILVAVGMIGAGFKAAAGDQAKELFAFATNPFMGLIIGTIATALIQSSSTVTSIIVGLVAGGLPVATAIPMVMGANIGTTITNTLVSLGHVKNKEEFRRAFSAATVHDFFNLLSVLIFLPLEIATGFLGKISAWASQFLVGGDSISMKGIDFVKPITKPVIHLVQESVSFLPGSMPGIMTILIGIGAIFLAITYIGKMLKALMVGRAKRVLHNSIGRGPISGIASGTFVTVLVQSSSTTTSLMVPLVGSGVFTMRDIYPFTLGANIGTCITALLAATAISGGNALFALQIALVHLLYNCLGVLTIYGFPLTRDIAPRCADWLANLAAERKSIALAYIVTVFFVFPGAMIFVFN
jgi:sodium-dependent phosphate cotransporter